MVIGEMVGLLRETRRNMLAGAGVLGSRPTGAGALVASGLPEYTNRNVSLWTLAGILRH